MKYFLAIDIGASSGRHMLGHIEDGALLLEEIYRFPNFPEKVGEELIWDTDRLWREIVTGLKMAKSLGKIPYSVAIDTWGVDYVLLDAEGNRLHRAHSYRDVARWEPAVQAVHQKIPFEKLYSITGIQFQPFNTVYQLWVDKREGNLDRADKLLMLPDYFHYRLTGKASREATNASTGGLIDTQTLNFSEEIIKTLGYPQKLFPTPNPAGTVLGQLTEEMAAELGYQTTVILPPTHDTASAVVGALAPEGELFLSSGTWSLLGVVEQKAHTELRSLQCNFTNEGHVGGKFRYLKNLTGLWMVQRLRAEEAPEQSFARLTALAATCACPERVDVNDKRFLSPENMKRELERAVGRELSLGEAVYVALSSLADGYKQAIDEIEGLTGRRYRTLNIMGGGSKNGLLNDMTAQATGKQILAGPSEATVVGNLAVQLVAAGELADLDEAKKLIKISSERGVL